MQRVRQGVQAVIEVAVTDQYGALAAAVGAVTVGVVGADGTVVVAAGAATVPGVGLDVGKYRLTLTAAQTARLDLLTATWTDGGSGATFTTRHRVVGAFMFTIDTVRAYDQSVRDSSKWPTAMLASERDAVEDEAEWICGRSFVPVANRFYANGLGTNTIDVFDLSLQAPVDDIRRVRGCRIYVDSDRGGTAQVLTAGQCASIVPMGGGKLRRTDGHIFDFGTANVVLDLEYGLDGPNEPMAKAAMQRLRSRLNLPKTGLPDRTRSVTTPDGQTIQLTGPDPYRTGIDAVDAVYGQNSLRQRPKGLDGDGNRVPASGTLSYDPQHYGLFRGGPR